MTSSIWLGDPRIIVIHRGRLFRAVFKAQFAGEPADLTGYEAEAQLRRYADGPLLATFTTGALDPDTDELGPLDESGEIWVELPSATTATLTTGGFWDLKLIQPNAEPLPFIGPSRAVLESRVTA